MINFNDVMAQHNASVPRYTSYPTAPQFQPEIGKSLINDLISGLTENDPVSVYLHIPFCDRLCWFCGCNTKHTLRYEPIKRYVQHMLKEIKLIGAKMPAKATIEHLHLGGGSPSLLQPDDMGELRSALEETFHFTEATEISVEIDPSDANPELFKSLQALGMTRASIGVQDFHEDVQQAINRPQTFEQTAAVVSELRRIGIKSINIDALYGLPLQSEKRLLQTLEMCVSLNPDRMALFGYAHVPWLKKHQQMIKTEHLAKPAERYQHAQSAAVFLQSSGYHPIGIDHFAKPGDSMCRAAKSGTLRRNFQGYTTDNTGTLVGIGGSSIGKFAGGYIQNTVATGIYEAIVASGNLPADKGYVLTDDDRMRGYFIERLMCDLCVDLSAVHTRFEHQYASFIAEIMSVVRNDNLGLCSLDNGIFRISEEARPFARIIASLFDAHFAPASRKFSQAV